MSVSTEKDPTCVVEMLNCLQSRRKSMANVRRGSSVSTRLQFENASLTSNIEMRASHYTNSQFMENQSANKRVRLSTQTPTGIAESPWEYQLMKANLLKAKSEIEVKENLIKQLHSVRREQEQVFENEKAALRLKCEEAQNLVHNMESRTETLTRRSRDFKEELAEAKSQLISSKQLYSENVRKLEKQNSDLREELAQAQLSAHNSTVNDQWRVTKLESELSAAVEESAGHQKRVTELEAKLREARHDSHQAETVAQQLQEAQFLLRNLDNEQKEQQEAMAMIKQQQQKLLKYPEMEREVERLRDDNGRLRGLVQNKLMLEEKVANLQSRLSGSEQRDRELAQLQAAHTGVQHTLQEWLTLARDLCSESGTAGVRQHFERLQQRELQLTADTGELKSRLKCAMESKSAASLEVADLKKHLDQMSNMATLQKSYNHRIKKRLQLVETERNSYRSQLDAYERDLTMTATAFTIGSQQEQQRMRIETLEKALEGYRELVARLESDMEKEKKDSPARGGAEHLDQMAALEAERNVLRRTAEEQRLKLEGLELEMQYRALKGDFNPSKTKVVHMRMNPQTEAANEHEDELAILRSECARLRERLRVMQEDQTGVVDLTLVTDERLKASNSAEIQELRSQVKSLELKLQRLKEAFKATSNEFREIVYMVLGYRIDRRDNSVYRLSSMYAESPDDVLTFKYDVSLGNVELMRTAYSNTLESFIDLHLRRQHSIPVFLSAVTLDLFSQQTFTGGTNTPDTSNKLAVDLTRP